MDKEENIFNWLFGTLAGWICFILLLIVLGAALTVVTLRLDTTLVQPEAKINKLRSADAQISNTNRYHTDLQNIISADNDLITQLNQAAAIKTAEPDTYAQDSRYSQIMIIQLPGLDQARHADISQYNADADNSNYNMDLPAGYPAKIADSSLPADPHDAVTMLQQQVQNLQQISSR